MFDNLVRGEAEAGPSAGPADPAPACDPAPAWLEELDDPASWMTECPRPEDDPLHQLLQDPSAVWSDPSPPDADELTVWTPSAEAAAVLAGADLDRMQDDDLVETVALWGRIAAWAQAHQMRAAAELDSRPLMNPDWSPRAGRVARRSVTAEEIAARLACSRTAAQHLVRGGRSFRGALAMTGDALFSGHIDQPKARELVKALDDVALEVAVLVQEEVLPEAPRLTPQQLADRIQEALLVVDPEDAEHRAAAATAARRVNRPKRLPDGMAGVWAVLPAPAAHAVHAELDLVARDLRATGDDRTLDQLRADVLVAAVLARHIPADVAESSSGSGSGSDSDSEAASLRVMARHLRETPVRAEVRVTVGLDVLLGASDAPARLEGYGAIPPAVARALAADGTWRRIVTDPLSGMVHDVGRTRYRPPADMARFVRTRDGTCARPGCPTPADLCQLDHTVPFGDPSHSAGPSHPDSHSRPDGPTASGDPDLRAGRTSTGNLAPLCKRDHQLKTHGGFDLLQDAPGVFTWITPTGQRIRREPRPVGQPRARDVPLDRMTLIRHYVQDQSRPETRADQESDDDERPRY